MVRIDTGGVGNLTGEISENEIKEALRKLNVYDGTGWMDLPDIYNDTLSQKIKIAADEISRQSEIFILVGVGGSYLGARAGLEYIFSPFYNNLPKKTPDIYFAGNNLSAEYLSHILKIIESKDFSVNIVSKSGSTIETAIAARFFINTLKKRYGNEYKKRVYITTDKHGSKLRETALSEGYSLFEIPEGVGGRYSVLSVAGLLPLAVCGADIDSVMEGAREEKETGLSTACRYAEARQRLYRNGKSVEILSCFEPSFRCMGEWWKQLFGESEGKENKGIFPTYADYTADLHSLGQYMQEGGRFLMETFVTFDDRKITLEIPLDGAGGDYSGLNIDYVNKAASQAVRKAHIDGGVPIIEIMLPEMNEKSLGALIYFFEHSCAVSAILSGVNPFDQPGVEAYKKNLHAILNIL